MGNPENLTNPKKKKGHSCREGRTLGKAAMVALPKAQARTWGKPDAFQEATANGRAVENTGKGAWQRFPALDQAGRRNHRATWSGFGKWHVAGFFEGWRASWRHPGRECWH